MSPYFLYKWAGEVLRGRREDGTSISEGFMEWIEVEQVLVDGLKYARWKV